METEKEDSSIEGRNRKCPYMAAGREEDVDGWWQEGCTKRTLDHIQPRRISLVRAPPGCLTNRSTGCNSQVKMPDWKDLGMGK